MGSKTGIEWTDATWNPIIGCSRVSEGCRNCYAEAIAGRFGNGKQTVYSGLTKIVNGRAVWTGQIAETRQLLQPLSWRQPKRVFVNSMSDLFHENVTDEQRDRIFAVMALCPQHTFQLLTKRPERMLAYIECRWKNPDSYIATLNDRELFSVSVLKRSRFVQGELYPLFPLLNVWLGVSVENQAAADERIALLLKTPAAKRFLSCEPLLGQVNLPMDAECEHPSLDGIDATACTDEKIWQCCMCKGFYRFRHISGSVAHLHEAIASIDWVICGGESGPHARPMSEAWARGLRDQCKAAGVPFFFKQWGEYLPPMCDGAPGDNQELNCSDAPVRVGKKAAGALLDGREWKEFPV
ncbi:MAG: phage Gp37/Gp68 family protein [Acidobacteria bacterium]|nr:phage Gp37/Gp68 family protein [Acidobacteriota bacterium]